MRYLSITLIFCLSVIFSCSSDLPLDEKFESKVEKEKKETEKKQKENEQSLNKGNLFLENNKKNHTSSSYSIGTSIRGVERRAWTKTRPNGSC